MVFNHSIHLSFYKCFEFIFQIHYSKLKKNVIQHQQAHLQFAQAKRTIQKLQKSLLPYPFKNCFPPLKKNKKYSES
jgi:hypothetical protein